MVLPLIFAQTVLVFRAWTRMESRAVPPAATEALLPVTAIFNKPPAPEEFDDSPKIG